MHLNRNPVSNSLRSSQAAAHAKHEAGLRESGGSLPGSAGGRTPINSPKSSQRSPTHATHAAPPPVSITSSTPTVAVSATITTLQKEMTSLRIALASAESEATHLNADNDRLAAALDIAKQQSEVALTSTAEMGNMTEMAKAKLLKAGADLNRSEVARERAQKEAIELREVAGQMQDEIEEVSGSKSGSTSQRKARTGTFMRSSLQTPDPFLTPSIQPSMRSATLVAATEAGRDHRR